MVLLVIIKKFFYYWAKKYNQEVFSKLNHWNKNSGPITFGHANDFYRTIKRNLIINEDRDVIGTASPLSYLQSVFFQHKAIIMCTHSLWMYE